MSNATAIMVMWYLAWFITTMGPIGCLLLLIDKRQRARARRIIPLMALGIAMTWVAYRAALRLVELTR